MGWSRTLAGLHGTALAVGAVISGLAQARVVARWGRRRTLWGGSAGVAAGAVLFCAGSTSPVTLAGALVAGASGGLLLNAVMAALAEHQGPAGPAAITETNALAAGIGVVAPLALGLGTALGVGWRPGVLAVLPFALVLWLALGRREVPGATPPRGSAGGAAPRLPAPYWAMWAGLVCFTGVEFCFTLWGADLVRVRSGVTAGLAAAAVSAFLAGFVVGRLAGARLATGRDTAQLLLGSLALCLLGFTVLWTAGSFVTATGGLFTVGLGAAVLFPLGVARAIQLSDGLTDLASGRSGLGVGIAAGTFPFLLGALADRVGVPAAFLLVVPALVLAGAAAVLATRRAPATVVR